MKKFFFIVIVFLFSSTKYAQESKKNVIKINSLLLISNIYDVQYERVLSDRSTIQLGFGIGKTNNHDLNDFQELYSDFFGKTLNNPRDTHHRKETISVNLDYRHYMRDHKAPKGFYIGPSIQYIKFKERFSALEQQPDEDGDTEALYTERLKQRDLELYNVRALLGYQFLVAQSISINPYAGPSFVFGDTDESFEREDENITGFGLNFGVAIGLVF
ncbi:hypothetical protein [Gelidibacter pelagius]|uniref:DUF3575 domain-containing protein n=1 Tax=Gelidibacter pelagius TaxID=2819985 RepID=A0ABS3STJ8_9FLAO|nr:hypothetical protein [Gelidibacter pelagius]MBO3099030.1 hypothetical protein [Gelidibacter pelagius]